MQVERNEDGSVTIKSKNGVTVISGITASEDTVHENKFEQWVEECAKLVKPNEHTFEETMDYFLTLCDTLPLENDDRRLQYFKSNIIINYFKDQLEHQASEFSFDKTEAEIRIWHKENEEMREEAFSALPERFGLVLSGYCLPSTKRNEFIYERSRLDWEQHNRNRSIDFANVRHQEICFFFEKATEAIQASGGGKELVQQLVLFRGIGKKDIEERNARFLGYISTLQEIGKLPSF